MSGYKNKYNETNDYIKEIKEKVINFSKDKNAMSVIYKCSKAITNTNIMSLLSNIIY